ncbi:g9001 [Coccomyxa elongata]
MAEANNWLWDVIQPVAKERDHVDGARRFYSNFAATMKDTSLSGWSEAPWKCGSADLCPSVHLSSEATGCRPQRASGLQQAVTRLAPAPCDRHTYESSCSRAQ